VELRRLRYFVAVAEERHFGKAAIRLQMAQSPLSQQILTLEREIGVLLFRRTPAGIVLTAAGEALFARARVILQQVDEAIESARAADRVAEQSLRLALCDSGNPDVFVALIKVLGEDSSALPLFVEFRSVAERLEGLRQHRYDAIALVDLPNLPDTWRSRVVRRERLLLALPTGHPVAKSGTVDLEAITEPMLAPPWLDPLSTPTSFAGVGMQIGSSRLAEAVMKRVERGHQTQLALEARLQLVAAGQALTLVLESSLRHYRVDGVTYRPLRSPLTTVVWSLVWLAEREGHPGLSRVHAILSRLQVEG
jgi:DNA-binding transcriptional LysR family regulator